ncbi:MAG: FAD-dependent monooxygenase [Bacteroidetes bacterium]|nr:MAG: FAD-dependent monooxygenase [Bacteroidota bacterium]REK05022.1 MAG: FAD-dependent monooxygenase [Bacteroidota bacterium]REK36475.1 MAG: FAD-dependent monooxygenase [Bacteroidota bacterium]REK51689.1 MAG: FAD-dependent monooxygenase [Bacteroidota bacterium]
MKKSKKVRDITILGAGLVGSLLSIYLAKRGYNVTIYERRPDMRKEKISAGRSINLALSDRGWKGLRGVGIEEQIREIAIPMHGRMMHDQKGKLSYQPYGKKNQSIYAASRGILNCEMMNLAEKHGVKIYFNERCTWVDLEEGTARMENQAANMATTIDSDLIFGADGAFSIARLQQQITTDRFEYSQSYLDHGYKELLIPPGKNGSFRMEKNALHIWPRGGYMLIALPNLDGSFTCTLFFPFTGKDSFESIRTKKQCVAFFKRVFPDVVPMMPTLTEDFFGNPTSSLVTVKCFPWAYKDKACLIGDAAHAIVPFYGQGMNCGFEDCTVLDRLMNKHKDDWTKILPEFQSTRKPDADAIAELAVMNFYEMRDKVGHPEFLLRKKIEARMHELHPSKWLPLYSQVTFSHTPYSKALANGMRQEEIMNEVMKMKNIQKIWHTKKVENFILNRIRKS